MPIISSKPGGERPSESPPPQTASPREVLSPAPLPTDAPDPIRPQTLKDYIGQQEMKASLQIAITAAKRRKQPIDHLLIYGPPGLGKTTIAGIIAQEMGAQLKMTTAPALERPRDVAGLAVSLKPGDILFIDEIHGLSRVSEELLYTIMEDFRLDITVGKGQSARIRSIALHKFTLIGATTKPGAMSSPLRDRFGLIQKLEYYQPEELGQIVERSAQILGVRIEADAALETGRRARGTPRIANRLLRRVRDYAEVTNPGQIATTEIVLNALELLQVDPLGLDRTDRLILDKIIGNFNGGPVGLETIAAVTGEDARTLETVYEPYLLQCGLLQRTERGRIVTRLGYEYLNYAKPESVSE